MLILESCTILFVHFCLFLDLTILAQINEKMTKSTQFLVVSVVVCLFIHVLALEFLRSNGHENIPVLSSFAETNENDTPQSSNNVQEQEHEGLHSCSICLGELDDPHVIAASGNFCQWHYGHC